MDGVDEIGGRSEEEAAPLDIVCKEESDFFIGLKLEFRTELRVQLQVFHFGISCSIGEEEIDFVLYCILL